MLRNKKKRKTSVMVSYIMLFLILFISIGFSAFCNELGIKDISAAVKVKKDIRITSISQEESPDYSYTENLDYNVSNINGTVTLINSDSYIDYKVKIVNYGTVEMGIKDITLNNEKLTYEILDYNIEDKLCSTEEEQVKCTLGNENIITIRLKWKEGQYDQDNTSEDFILDFNFQNFHKVIVEETIKDIITDCPSEVLNTSNLTFKYVGDRFDVRMYMNGVRITEYVKSDNMITIENVTGTVVLKYITYGIENGSFEFPSIGSTYFKYVNADLVPSWNITAVSQDIEFGKINNNISPHLNIDATNAVDSTLPDGNQFAEINANEKATLYQDITVIPGVNYNWNLFHRGRGGQEVMALIIGDKQQNEPKKVDVNSDDQYNAMVEWVFEQKSIDLNVPTIKFKYKIYSAPFDSNGGFEIQEDPFSFTEDDVHTKEWDIWIISSSHAKWFEYSDSYTPNSSEITIALCSVVSIKKDNLSYGNLIENVSFKEEGKTENKIINGSFEDVTIPYAYKIMVAKNGSGADANIGWSSTSIDKKVEVGNFEVGKKTYGIDKDYINYMAYVKDGINFIELNAQETGTVYQNFLTEQGKKHEWSIAHRGRDGIDYMAMFIGPTQEISPMKPGKKLNDQFMKMLDWIKSNINLPDYGLDILNEETGCSQKISLYTAEFEKQGAFSVSDDEAISLTKDDIHNQQWDVWIIGTDNTDWKLYGFKDENRNYDDSFVNSNNVPETTMAFANFSTWGMRNGDTKGDTIGNLLDYILWK